MIRRLALPLLLSIAGLAAAQPGDHTLNLKDADIRALIATVSEITGESFIVDPRVEGKVNVVSTRPMSVDEVYAVFESVLRVHGYAAVRSGSMVKIVPEAVAKQDGDALAPVAARSSGPDTLQTRVIELRHVPANEMLPILTQLIPQSGQMSVHPGSNSLVVTDRAGNLARIEQIVRRIDQASDTAVEVIPLEHASAAELARTLALLVDDKAVAIPGTSPAKVFADTRTNSLLLSGDRAGRLRIRALVSHLDTPLDSGESTQVVYLRYAKAADLVPILEQTAQTLTGDSTAENAAKSATIQAHEETNAVVVTASPAVYRALASVIRQLDVRRAQVLIEGVIAEVSDNLAREIGVQWFVAPERGDGTIGTGVIGGTNFPGSSNTGLLGTATNPLAVGAGLSLGYVEGTITIGGREILNLGALVRALANDGRSNILSRPQIVTLDHQEAEIRVGQEVPFLTGQYTNTSTNGGTNLPTNPFQTIERRDVGLKLIVTPHINEGDSVRLDLEQEVSSLANNVVGASDLITNKRELKTSVLVGDGAMLVLGGLISEETLNNVSKVPALGDIPVVGNLFRYRNKSRIKRDLMVFLRPTILRDAVLEETVSSDKYNFMRARQLDARANFSGRPDPETPVLPEQPWSPPMRLPEAPPPR